MARKMSVEQACFELDIFGFTVIPSVLGGNDIEKMSALLDEADRERGIEYNYENAYARLVTNVPAIDNIFLGLIDHPAVLPVLEEVLGSDLVLGSMNARLLRPGDPEQGLHSDIPVVHRRQLGKPVMLQSTWMIDPFTAENGATRIVPGSHRAATSTPPEALEVPHLIAPTGPAGSILIFNGQCWHGGGENRTQNNRRAIFGHYRVGPWMRFQTDPAQNFPQERWRAMSARQREIMRMEFGINQKNAADHYADQSPRGRYD